MEVEKIREVSLRKKLPILNRVYLEESTSFTKTTKSVNKYEKLLMASVYIMLLMGESNTKDVSNE